MIISIMAGILYWTLANLLVNLVWKEMNYKILIVKQLLLTLDQHASQRTWVRRRRKTVANKQQHKMAKKKYKTDCIGLRSNARNFSRDALRSTQNPALTSLSVERANDFGRWSWKCLAVVRERMLFSVSGCVMFFRALQVISPGGRVARWIHKRAMRT